MQVSCWQRYANALEALVGEGLFEMMMGVKTIVHEQPVGEPGADVPRDRSPATDEAVVLDVPDRFHDEDADRTLAKIEQQAASATKNRKYDYRCEAR